MYLYELHLHTSETSKCGKTPAADMVRAYWERGFAGLVVTDHFVNGYSYARDCEDWNDKVNAYLKGYRAAKPAGDALGVDVFLGWEFTYRGNGEDYLTLGLSEDFLWQNKDCGDWEIERYRDAVHKAGGILIRAHPYREAGYIEHPGIVRDGMQDAIEVFNAGNASRVYDDKALAYAEAHSLPMVAGSDTHGLATVAQGYVGFSHKMESYKALCDAIVAGEAHVFRAPNQAE